MRRLRISRVARRRQKSRHILGIEPLRGREGTRRYVGVAVFHATLVLRAKRKNFRSGDEGIRRYVGVAGLHVTHSVRAKRKTLS